MVYPVKLDASALLFPLGLLATMTCGTALGLIVVPCTALFSDIGRAIHLGLRFAFFLTTVIFTVPVSGWGRRSDDHQPRHVPVCDNTVLAYWRRNSNVSGICVVTLCSIGFSLLRSSF